MNYLLNSEEDNLEFEDEFNWLDGLVNDLYLSHNDVELNEASSNKNTRIKKCSNNKAVEKHWSRAITYTSRAVQRLNNLSRMPEHSRKLEWNKREKLWFGNYGNVHFNTIRRRMININRIINSSRLKIICVPKNINLWGKTLPAIYKIKLHLGWLKSTNGFEKTLTLIHESAHIAGLGNLSEKKNIGVKPSKALACNSQRQTRFSAENYANYAMIFSTGSFPSDFFEKIC